MNYFALKTFFSEATLDIPQSCSDQEFFCNETFPGKCIAKNLYCNGIVECPNGEDERYCPTRAPITCKQSEFSCKNGLKCIPRIWFCDEDDDCGDNSDESHPCSKYFHFYGTLKLKFYYLLHF